MRTGFWAAPFLGSTLRASGIALAVSVASFGPSAARAFSDPAQFALPAAAGGGGGRYFTASPMDGYGCNVCHRGGPEPKLNITGLPTTGYVPGQTYEIQLTWENPSVSHGIQLELVGRDGRVPGQVTLVEPAALDARAHCGGVPTGKVASYERVVGARKIIGVEACKAQSLRFRFTPANVSDLAFSLSAITSDTMASVEGDGVTNMRKILRRQGESVTTGDCSASAQGGSSWSALGLLAALALFVRGRSTKR